MVPLATCGPDCPERHGMYVVNEAKDTMDRSTFILRAES